jgi:hypothetical protein
MRAASDVEVTMWRKLAVFLALVGSAIGVPARAFAQWRTAQADDWFGPWFMWGGGWSSLWWICPLMMLAMMLVMMFVCRFFMWSGWHSD